MRANSLWPMGTREAGDSERFGGHYDEWTENRIGWILAEYGDDVFRDRTVLDIGGGRGPVGHRPLDLGAAPVRGGVGRRLLDLGAAAVEVVEGRLENIREAQPRAGLTFTHANLERGLVSAHDA